MSISRTIASPYGGPLPWERGGGAAPVDNPISIFGAKLMSWLRADDVVLGTGSRIATFNDKSGNGRKFTQATAGNRADQVASGGVLAARFDYTRGDYYSLSGTSYSSPAAVHVIRVMKRNADPPAAIGATGLDNFGTLGNSHIPFTDGVIYDSTCRNPRATVGNPGTSLTALNVYETISTAAKFEALLNGVSLYSTTASFVSIQATPTIGNANTLYMDGYIFEHIVLNAEASVGERAPFAAYILARYGHSII